MTRDSLVDLEPPRQLEAPVAVNKEGDVMVKLLHRSPEARNAMQYLISVEQSYGLVIFNDVARRALTTVMGESALARSGSAESLRSASSDLEEEEGGVKRRTVFAPMPALPVAGAVRAGAGSPAPLSPHSSNRTPGSPAQQLPVQPKSLNRSPNNSARNLAKDLIIQRSEIQRSDIQRSDGSVRSNRSRPPDELRMEWHSVLLSAGIASERVAVVADVLVFELIEPAQLGLLETSMLTQLGISESDSQKILAWHANQHP